MTIIERHQELSSKLIGLIAEFKNDISTQNEPIIPKPINAQAEIGIGKQYANNLIHHIKENHENFKEAQCIKILLLNQLCLFPSE